MPPRRSGRIENGTKALALVIVVVGPNKWRVEKPIPSLSLLLPPCVRKGDRERGKREEEGGEGMPGNHDQRSRSARGATIHGCAQSGDLLGLQRRLQENPSLLNARNAVVGP
ncbi:hypothetical protein BHE74_00004150 [Ensete ventricosum]|nr:hypothetical protein BHE74_00004150 [Ensete ventricosum]